MYIRQALAFHPLPNSRGKKVVQGRPDRVLYKIVAVGLCVLALRPGIEPQPVRCGGRHLPPVSEGDGNIQTLGSSGFAAVCVCVCVRERACMCLCVCERERACMCLCV